MKLGNIRISADISDEVDDMVDELNDDIDDAVAEATSQTAHDGMSAAKKSIRTNGAIWRHEVLHNWVPIREKTEFGTHVTGYQNYADHAAAVNDGATYDQKKPPIEALREYVTWQNPGLTGYKADQFAFNLREKIYREGLPGIDYVDDAEKRMQQTGRQNLSKELDKI